jgi:hypothetical protein
MVYEDQRRSDERFKKNEIPDFPRLVFLPDNFPRCFPTLNVSRKTWQSKVEGTDSTGSFSDKNSHASMIFQEFPKCGSRQFAWTASGSFTSISIPSAEHFDEAQISVVFLLLSAFKRTFPAQTIPYQAGHDHIIRLLRIVGVWPGQAPAREDESSSNLIQSTFKCEVSSEMACDRLSGTSLGKRTDYPNSP